MDRNLTYQDIIDKIGFYMNKGNISAYDLSLKLGHCENYIYKIQTGRINLSIKTFLSILEILGVSIREFFN